MAKGNLRCPLSDAKNKVGCLTEDPAASMGPLPVLSWERLTWTGKLGRAPAGLSELYLCHSPTLHIQTRAHSELWEAGPSLRRVGLLPGASAPLPGPVLRRPRCPASSSSSPFSSYPISLFPVLSPAMLVALFSLLPVNLALNLPLAPSPDPERARITPAPPCPLPTCQLVMAQSKVAKRAAG